MKLSMALALLVLVSGCDECPPGIMRRCALGFDGGATGSGYQVCQSSGWWSSCFSAGTCSGGGSLPAYSRCSADDECGPADCAVCNRYDGVVNPEGQSVCEVFCRVDADCAPTAPSSDVTPKCFLGQCALLCRTSSMCPLDTECMPWADATSGEPGFDGLCE